MKNVATRSYGLGLLLGLALIFSLSTAQVTNAWEDDGYVYDGSGHWIDDGMVYDSSGNWFDDGIVYDGNGNWVDDGYVYDNGGWNDDGYVYDNDGWNDDGYVYDDGGCYDYCGDDYDGCYDYCGDDYGDYDYDYCDDYCDDFYEETEYFSDSCYNCSRGSQGQMYSSSVPRSFASPRVSSFATKFANVPARQNPVIIPNNRPRPVFQATPVSNNTVITNTNIDNSINDSFNDNSYNDYSVNGSFNNYNSNNTAVAIGGTWGTVTPIAAIAPGRTIAAVLPNYVRTTTYVPPIVRANPQYVALSQIPYTGFDLGPVGNAIYWMSLLGVSAAGAYLLIYYKGGALLFVGSLLKGSNNDFRNRYESGELSVLPTLSDFSEKKEVVNSTKDTMSISSKGIVINRNY